MRIHQSLSIVLLSLFSLTSTYSAAQSTLSSGDIAIIHLNTGNEEFQFVTLVDLLATTEIFFTDNTLNGTNAIGTSEGTVLYTAPVGGVLAGTVITYSGISGDFSSTTDGNMALNNSGDNLAAYQGTLSNPTTILYAVAENATMLGTLPSGFTSFVYLGNDDGVYTGARTGLSASGYISLINDVTNWAVSGSVAVINSTAFVLAPSPPCTTPASATALSFNTVGPTSLAGSFALSATADDYLVLRTPTNTAPVLVDGTVYTAGNIPASSTLESNGSSITFNSTGLMSSTQYFYHVYAYTSSSCTGGPLYAQAITNDATTTASLSNSMLYDFDAVTDLVLNTSTGIMISAGSVANPSGNSFGASGNGAYTNNGTDTVATCVYTINSISSFEFSLASLSGTAGNGADAGDNVRVDVSINGGVTYTTVMTVTGSSNSQWLHTAVDSAVASYATPATDGPAGGGDRTSTDGIGKVKITDIPAGDIVIRIRMTNNSPNEYWAIDDLKLSTVPSAAFDLTVQGVINEYITNLGTTSTLTWNNPYCFSNIVIIAKEGSAPTFDPLSNNCGGTNGDCLASNFTASSAFGGGGSNANLPALEYCVYNGTGEEVTVTGLMPNVVYHYEIFTHLNPWSTKSNSPDLSLMSLPVDLISFEGKIENGQIALSWSTASEKNNSHFEVYKSQDYRNFEKIGRVEGNGNTSNIIDYTYTDLDVMSTQYYQLKQIDYDGQFEYSEIIAVTGDQRDLDIVVETSEKVMISPVEKTSVLLINQNGQILFNRQISEDYTLNKDKYRKGLYVLRVMTAAQVQTIKWINYK